jgi:hypothetical protein
MADAISSNSAEPNREKLGAVPAAADTAQADTAQTDIASPNIAASESAEADPPEFAPLLQGPGPSGPMPPPPPQTQLPVADLIGLRFSLQHLRLVGYGLLAAWLAELINLLSSPGLFEIAARLQSISQLLDLSPILLVGIGLVSFQGGLRRSWLEMACLPLLLALLPLLSAFHFFLAPVSVANVVTLVQKQQQIGLDQLQRIDRQIDRASQILAESDSIDALLDGLQRIPGLQVRVPANAEVSEARLQVRGSLEKERDRIKQRITANLANSRNAFLRRAAITTALAILMGLLLWGLHRGAMAEMGQSIPYLQWVLTEAEALDNPLALVQLIDFQRACVALGWFTMLESSVRFVRRRLGLADAIEEESEPLPPEPIPKAAAGRSLQQRLKPMLPFNAPLPPGLLPPPVDSEGGEAGEDNNLSTSLEQEAWLKQQRQQQEKDLRRYRRRANLREEPEEIKALREGNEQLLRELDELRSQPPRPPQGLRGLVHWFLTHL